VNLLGACPSVETLRTELADASQLWLISTSSAILSPGHMDFIVDEWRKGLALYVFGDNDPFYVDANVLLKVGSLCCGCPPSFCFVEHGTPVLCIRGAIHGALAWWRRPWGFHKCRATTVPAST
jgi:hypothetical protein